MHSSEQFRSKQQSLTKLSFKRLTFRCNAQWPQTSDKTQIIVMQDLKEINENYWFFSQSEKSLFLNYSQNRLLQNFLILDILFCDQKGACLHNTFYKPWMSLGLLNINMNESTIQKSEVQSTKTT